MHVNIRSTPTVLQLSTVSIGVDTKNPANVILFHCYQCGGGVSQIKGDIIAISGDFEPQTDSVVVVQNCRYCASSYTFQEELAPKRREITLSIFPNAERRFHCIICHLPLVSYREISHFPHPFTCMRCQRNYLLKEMLTL